ncbi:MAG: Flp family type IVb pilin [Rhodospirillales bacterium]
MTAFVTNATGAVRRFLRDRRGATALEYGLIVMCIFLAIIVAVTMVGNDASDTFNSVANSMDNAIQ